MSIEIRVHGHETLARRFENVHARMRVMEDATAHHLDLILANTRPRTPARTYKLRGAWERGPIITRGTKFVGVAGNPLFYAHMIERGFKSYTGKRMLEQGIAGARPLAEANWRGVPQRLMQAS